MELSFSFVKITIMRSLHLTCVTCQSVTTKSTSMCRLFFNSVGKKPLCCLLSGDRLNEGSLFGESGKNRHSLYVSLHKIRRHESN